MVGVAREVGEDSVSTMAKSWSLERGEMGGRRRGNLGRTKGHTDESNMPTVRRNRCRRRSTKGYLPRDDARSSLARREGLWLVGRRETVAAVNSDLLRGGVERVPGRGIGERENHCGFPVHKALVKLIVVETTAERLYGRGGGVAG